MKELLWRLRARWWVWRLGRAGALARVASRATGCEARCYEREPTHWEANIFCGVPRGYWSCGLSVWGWMHKGWAFCSADRNKCWRGMVKWAVDEKLIPKAAAEVLTAGEEGR